MNEHKDPREAFIMGAIAESQTRYSPPPTERVRREHMSSMFDEWAAGRWPPIVTITSTTTITRSAAPADPPPLAITAADRAVADGYGVRLREPTERDRCWCKTTNHTTRGSIVFDVTIRRVADGAERKYEDSTMLLGRDTVHEAIASSRYLWSDGNQGCDCNRAHMFALAGGEEPVRDRGCGDGAYVVIAPAWLADK